MSQSLTARKASACGPECRPRRGDALHLGAGQEARDVDVVDGHVHELAAARRDVVRGRRVGIVAHRSEEMEPPELAGGDAAARLREAGVEAPLEADLERHAALLHDAQGPLRRGDVEGDGLLAEDRLPRAGRRLDLLGMRARRGDDHDGLHLAIEDGLPGIRDGPRPVAGPQLPGGRRGIGDDREAHLRQARQGASVRRAEAARAQEGDPDPTAGHQRTLPRADTGHTTSTRSPRTPTSSSIMLDTTQQ